jgi:hypothetical protein
MVKAKKPEGFITITADTTPVTGATQRDVDKKVPEQRQPWGTCSRAGVCRERPANKFPGPREGYQHAHPVVPGAIRQGTGREREQDGVGRAQHTERFHPMDKRSSTRPAREGAGVPVTQAKKQGTPKRESEREKARNAKLSRRKRAAREGP